jgi:hypothetical protein
VLGDHPTHSLTESFLTPPWCLPGNYARNLKQADVESRLGTVRHTEGPIATFRRKK